MRIEGSGDEILAGGRARIIWTGSRKCEPVTKVVVTIPDIIVTGTPAHVLDPFRHALVLFGEHAFVAISEIHRPGNDHGGIGPSSGTSPSARCRQHVGNHIRYAARLELIRGHVFKP